MARPDRQLREIISAPRIRRRIEEIGEALSRDYGGRSVLLVVIAEGARRLADALIEQLQVRGLSPEVVVLRARRTDGTSLREVRIEGLDLRGVLGRDVLIIEDVVDEGRTLQAVSSRVREAGARSARTVVLISKLSSRQVGIPLDYVGFEIEDGWVVGFGMDLDQEYRDLDHVAIVEEMRPRARSAPR